MMKNTQNNDRSIAVLGAGYWGKNLVRNFAALGALKSVFDSDAETARTIAALYPEVERAPSIDSIMADPAIRGVAIATPAESHARLTRQALLAGKDVFVEKPLCLSESEAREVVALAREKEAVLMVGHLLWYHPAILRLGACIRNGELGKIQYIYSNRLNLGKLRKEENVLWSFAPHDISVILGLMDALPVSVQATGGNYLRREIADTTLTVLEFASGVQAHIFVSWLHPFKEQKLVVVGDRQMAVFDDSLSWPEKLQLYPHVIDWQNHVPVAHKAVAVTVPLEQTEPLRAECQHFLECLHSRTTPRTDGHEGLRVLQVLNGCQESLANGRKISLANAQPTPPREYSVHPSAIIDDGVKIGRGTAIWHFSHLLAGCQVGAGCSIGQNVVIGKDVHIGNGCKIQNNVSVFEGVRLEDHVFCGPSMVFTNVYNPRCEFSRKHEYKKTLVQKGATLGANCCIVCGVTIGSYAFVGAGAVVTRDIPPFALVAGNPARQIGWMSRFGERIHFPPGSNSRCTCPHTGEVYLLTDSGCQMEEAPRG